MKTTIATYKQTLLDIALQSDGAADKAMAIAIKNGVSISDDIAPGTQLDLDDAPLNRPMADYYAVNALRPATAIDDAAIINGGINYMGIEIDFIVS